MCCLHSSHLLSLSLDLSRWLQTGAWWDGVCHGHASWALLPRRAHYWNLRGHVRSSTFGNSKWRKSTSFEQGATAFPYFFLLFSSSFVVHAPGIASSHLFLLLFLTFFYPFDLPYFFTLCMVWGGSDCLQSYTTRWLPTRSSKQLPAKRTLPRRRQPKWRAKRRRKTKDHDGSRVADLSEACWPEWSSKKCLWRCNDLEFWIGGSYQVSSFFCYFWVISSGLNIVLYNRV
jgi:hypothetical protein